MANSDDNKFPVSFRKFECLQCGKCCTLTVEPTPEDIRKIELLGYKRMHFLRNGALRKRNGICMFLKKGQDGHAYCNIHEMKPRVCRDYPFTVLSRDRLFSCPGLHVNEK